MAAAFWYGKTEASHGLAATVCPVMQRRSCCGVTRQSWQGPAAHVPGWRCRSRQSWSDSLCRAGERPAEAGAAGIAASCCDPARTRSVPAWQSCLGRAGLGSPGHVSAALASQVESRQGQGPAGQSSHGLASPASRVKSSPITAVMVRWGLSRRPGPAGASCDGSKLGHVAAVMEWRGG